MIGLIQKGFQFSRRVSDDKVPVYAGQATLFIIFSVFPFIMLLLTLIQYISPLSQADLVSMLNGLVPDYLNNLVNSIVDELYTNNGTLISITIITALWSASRGILAIEQGLNNVFHVKETRGYLKLRITCFFYTIIFIVIVLFSLIILVFGNKLQMFLEQVIPVIAHISGYIISIRTILAVGILTLFFTAMYALFPGRKTSLKRQFPGAVFTTAGWLIFSFVFSIYIDNFSNFSYMYGSLTAIVLAMLWLYICMQIVLIGAEINVFLNDGENDITPIQPLASRDK